MANPVKESPPCTNFVVWTTLTGKQQASVLQVLVPMCQACLVLQEEVKDDHTTPLPKITPVHLERKAVVYIRQSTIKQVRTNTESQRNQRALVERAQALGWPKERFVVLYADLGQSGASTTGRDDFTMLTADVALGHVGIIFGWEVSRLARNNAY